MISGKMKRHLRARANHIRSTVYIGKAGLNPEAIAFIDQAFSNTDLLKVKMQRSYPGDRDSLAHLLSQIVGTTVVQVLGNTILLYRPLADSE
jgi:RNA-binding protein